MHLFAPFLLLCSVPIANANVHVVKIRPDLSDRLKAKRAVCELPLAVGNCNRKFTRFYWDIARGHCHKFFYSGCGGNGNRFLSRHQCKRRCSVKFQRKAKIAAKVWTIRRNRTECALNCANGNCEEGKCQCRKGFEVVGAECIDSNECHWAKCAENAHCVNLAGSFRCECLHGFGGSGFNCTKEKSICGQWFDRRYERQCNLEMPREEWRPRWYFDLRAGKCRQFWYGGCQFGESQNFFLDKKSCQSICADFVDAKSIYEGRVPSNGCLAQFDESLRRPCKDGIWKRRYFFDAKSARCRVFWMDASCPHGNIVGKSRNLFGNLIGCKKACEKDWGVEKWRPNGGEEGGPSGVIQASFWKGNEDCRETKLADSMLALKGKKERVAKLKAKMRGEKGRGRKGCLEEFDWNLTKNCGDGPWQVEYYFDHKWGKCRPFWNNGCRSGSGNHFGDGKTCRRMCEGEGGPKMATGICEEPFDQEYRKACQNGKGWTRKWFFDQQTGFCRYFWYDGCKGRSRNIFDGLKECMDACLEGNEQTAKPTETAKRQFAYFGSGETSMGAFWAFKKDYLRSERMNLDENECTGFGFNATGKARLSAFLCLLEEGGGCQFKALFAANGAQQCHRSRPWLRGKHSYSWFFTLERNPTMDPEGGEGRPGSGILTLRQLGANLTKSAFVPIEPFGQQNETIAWVDLYAPTKNDCHQIC